MEATRINWPSFTTYIQPRQVYCRHPRYFLPPNLGISILYYTGNANPLWNPPRNREIGWIENFLPDINFPGVDTSVADRAAFEPSKGRREVRNYFAETLGGQWARWWCRVRGRGKYPPSLGKGILPVAKCPSYIASPHTVPVGLVDAESRRRRGTLCLFLPLLLGLVRRRVVGVSRTADWVIDTGGRGCFVGVAIQHFVAALDLDNGSWMVNGRVSDSWVRQWRKVQATTWLGFWRSCS